MTNKEWFNLINEHKVVMRQFINDYHPSSDRKGDTIPLPITAVGAEFARVNVANLIKTQEKDDAHPCIKFDLALANQDVISMNSILNGAWFGVPESTSCWNIKGFREVVSALENPPDDDDDIKDDEPSWEIDWE